MPVKFPPLPAHIRRTFLYNDFIMNPFRKPAPADPATFVDDDLIRAVASGSVPALSALYDRFARLIFSLAVNIVSDSALAEEITQDVFVQVWNKAGTFHADQGHLNTWLSSITRHRAIDMLRRRGVRMESHQVGWDDSTTPDLPDDFLVEENLETQQRQRRVRMAVAALPENQQRALALAYFKGYTHQQVAEELGEPLGTVKTRIRLAMQKLREVLADVDP